MNISNESFPSSPKINSNSTSNLNIQDNKNKKRIKNSISVKQFNNIPLNLIGSIEKEKNVMTSRTPHRKIIQTSSLLHMNSHTRSSIVSSRIHDNVSAPPKEIPNFSHTDQMKMLNKIFPNEMKNNCNKICCNENHTKFFCAICQSEVQFSSADYLFIGGYYYHLKCLRCSSCSANLHPPFYIEKASKIYCSYCWFNRKSNYS